METTAESPYELLLKAALLIPISHYVYGILFLIVRFLYNFLEIHFINDLFTAFRGQPVNLIFNSSSDLYHEVVSKCKILHGRYASTPWLCSPHLQTAFLSFVGRAPAFKYRRQIFQFSDGGTIALDWLMNTDVKKPLYQVKEALPSESKDPIMIVIPGLTSGSESDYLRHLAYETAKLGWNFVVSNHRGLAGISITSDCFYNAGWTSDIRKVIEHIHDKYPEAPLFLVGTSIGANVLVKFLGEDGANIPIFGAAAMCSPWDLLICDRFISRRGVQKFYNKALTVGLKSYAQLHHSVISRLADWECISKSRTLRDFDTHATSVLGKYETVDTYYRRNSSTSYVGNVMVPLLCISALDDPVCTNESIPWDECRLNKNIVLATTEHGGHLAYFEGLTAKRLWWVRAVNEFSSILLTSPLIHKEKELTKVEECSIDEAPFVNIQEDGLVAAIAEPTYIIENEESKNERISGGDEVNDEVIQSKPSVSKDETQPDIINNIIAPVRKRVDELARTSTKSIWLLVYLAIVTTWPILGSGLRFFFNKKIRNVGNLSKR